MKFPALKKGKNAQFAVEALQGGCNLRDGKRNTADTQLCVAENVWWYNGALRSRPFFARKGVIQNWSVDKHTEWKFSSEDSVIKGMMTRRFLCKEQLSTQSTATLSVGSLYVNGAIGVNIKLQNMDPSVTGMFMEYPYTDTENLLLFLSDDNIYALGENGQCRQVNDEAYVPCIFVGGRGISSVTDKAQSVGQPYEARNLLTDKFMARYTATETGKIFHLPYTDIDADKPVTVSVVTSDGREITYTVPANETYSGLVDNRKVRVERDRGYFFFVDPANNMTVPEVSSANNITAYASKVRTYLERIPIAHMSFSTWFGGSRTGNDACLFFSGSQYAKNRIYWTAPGRPLYFPQTNYMEVGDINQAVTAFGKQDGSLVIFKENEIYYLQPRQSGSAAATKEYSLLQLHGKIGCSAPKTVVLCGNRLCWADGHGRAYTLVKDTPGFVAKEISGLISPALQKHTAEEWKEANAALYKGYYLLQVGHTVYALRVDDKAFQQYSNGYSDSKAQQLVWYVWTIESDFDIGYLFGDGNTAVGWVRSRQEDPGGKVLVRETTVSPCLPEDGQEGQFTTFEKPNTIQMYFRTKDYTLDNTVRKKRVLRTYLGLEATDDAQIECAYLRDGVVYPEQKKLCGEIEGDVVLTPQLSASRRFGFECRWKGQVAVDNLTFVYR